MFSIRIYMTKNEIRKEYKLIRSNITHKGEKSRKICAVLSELEEYKKAKITAVYSSLEDETNTSPIIESALKSGKTVLLPKIDIGGKMDFFKFSLELKENEFGIKEPQGTKKYAPGEIDLLIMPLVCADENRNRIGFGGGYYDRYLSDYKGKTIGICFDEQISPLPLPCAEHDIKPDIIVSDKRVLKKD